ncbi:MAG: peptidylprolyl isomerase [Kiritimatiellae bacterium]|nr:peptidylprolyl isomerase [Kiritimatiellia bacterium]
MKIAINKTIAGAMTAAFLLAYGCNRNEESTSGDGKTAENPQAVVSLPEKQNAAKKTEPVAKTPTTSKPSADMVVARVDDAILTASGVEAQIKLRTELLKLRKRKVGEKELDKLGKILSRTAADHFIRRELLSKYARNNGITLTDQEKNDNRAKVAASYKMKDFATLKARLSPASAALLERDTVQEALSAKCEKAIRDGVSKTVSLEEKQNILRNIETMNETAAKTNTLIFARARNVYNQVKSGKLTFEEAVEDYSEAEETEDGGAWNEFLISELKDEPELTARLPTMSPGDITPPIENDNGLSIMKLVSIGEYRKGDAAPEPTYRLARVFFRLPLFMEVPTDEELTDAIIKERQKQALSAALQKTGDASKIEGGRKARLEKQKKATAFPGNAK